MALSATLIRQKIKNRKAEKEIAPVNSEFGKNLEMLAGLSCENITENKIIIKINKQEESSHNNGVKEKMSSKKNIYLQIERILKFSIPVLAIAAGIFGTFFFREKNAPASSDMPAKINAIVYQGYLQKARQNQQDAETALIYKDEKKAGELLKEAGELIEKSMQMGAPDEDFGQLKKDIQAQIDQIDKVTTIQSPFLICDISESLSETFDGSKISVENGVFSIIDIANSKIADIDIATYKAKNVSDISLPPYISSSDYGEYGGSIYILDKTENQIFKLAAEQKKAWIKQAGIDLSSAVSMSIDGNIYVLNSGGIISKFTSGKLKASFQIAGLEKPEKIFVQAEGDKLAILDPSAKKIVITAKNGELLSRLKSDCFDDLKDVYIDSSTNGMYVLNGNKIYRVDL